MEKVSKKRSSEKEIQDSFSESLNKKIKTEIDYELIKTKFKCADYYIDKSLIIKEFLEDGSNYICITRPSNYGKSTNLIMMREFFQMNYENEENSENRKLFEKLNIAKEVDINEQKYIDGHLGKYPVVFIDFNGFKIGYSFDETIINFRYFIKRLYKNYKKIKIDNLDDDDKRMWENFMKGSINIINVELLNSINFLCDCLNNVFNKKVILLIDNYDMPILNAFNTEFYDKFYDFYKEVIMNIFDEDKIKNFLFKTFISGKFLISFLKKDELINHYGVTNNKYNEYYSITDSELKKLLSELKLENKIDKKFEENCTNNIYSYINSTVINNPNIFISSSFFNSISTTRTNTDIIISATNTTNNLSTTSTNTTNTASTNTIDDNIINIYNSSSHFHINDNYYYYNNNMLKCYDLFFIKKYIENINESNKNFENSKNFMLIQDIFNVFKDFDYFMIKI